MIKIDVCIETVFTELPYIERIKKVAKIGFPGAFSCRWCSGKTRALSRRAKLSKYY